MTSLKNSMVKTAAATAFTLVVSQGVYDEYQKSDKLSMDINSWIDVVDCEDGVRKKVGYILSSTGGDDRTITLSDLDEGMFERVWKRIHKMRPKLEATSTAQAVLEVTRDGKKI